MSSGKTLILISTLLAWFAAAQAASLRAEIGSRFLAEGEQTVLEFILSDASDPGGELAIEAVPNLNISSVGFGAEPRFGLGRRREYVFRYVVSTYRPGEYTIPAATLELSDGAVRSEPIDLRVFRESEIEWSTVKVGGRMMRYAAAFHVTDTRPYVNEVVPTELKLYIPNEQRIEDWGIPEFKRDGVAAWRFEPRPALGRAKLLGRNYYAVSYPSTVSPTRAGAVRLGPATLRLVTVQSSIENFGRAFYEQVFLNIPELPIEARPLPPGAPEGFEDAIGKFELSVSTADTEVREGDPVSVNILIRGKGNLDTLNVPKPVNEDGWRLYPSSPQQRDDRRSNTGFTLFRQFMRPLRPQDQIPPFRLVYFDPDQETYATLLSRAIPLTVIPSSGPGVIGSSVPPALPMPVEQMTDILGIATGGPGLLSERPTLPVWIWQVLPAALTLFLLLSIFRTRIAPKLRKDPDELARLRDLRTLEKAPNDLRGFYRAAGHFVERWLGNSEDPVPREVLAKRDVSCFKKDVQDESVPRSERQRILRSLRKLALPLVLLILTIGDGRLMAAEEVADPAARAYEDGRYSEAARLWLESGPYERLSADTLYNIGNASYRLGSPGEAALFWRRSLERDPSHAEARQNLRFFERKFGSIVIKRPDHQYILAKLPLETWKGLVWAGAWIVGLSLLTFYATRPGAIWRIAAISGLVAAPLVAITGFCGWYYYPDDADFAPTSEQAVIISEKSNIRTDASRNASLVIEAPAGSLCRVLTQSGEWSYVTFSTDTRGWIPTAEIERVVPLASPKVPRIRRTTDDEASA